MHSGRRCKKLQSVEMSPEMGGGEENPRGLPYRRWTSPTQGHPELDFLYLWDMGTTFIPKLPKVTQNEMVGSYRSINEGYMEERRAHKAACLYSPEGRAAAKPTNITDAIKSG